MFFFDVLLVHGYAGKVSLIQNMQRNDLLLVEANKCQTLTSPDNNATNRTNLRQHFECLIYALALYDHQIRKEKDHTSAIPLPASLPLSKPRYMKGTQPNATMLTMRAVTGTLLPAVFPHSFNAQSTMPGNPVLSFPRSRVKPNNVLDAT